MMIAGRRLTKHFNLKRENILRGQATLKAVDEVNIEVEQGSVVGVVGESGSGKSTLGRMLVNLLPSTKGHVLFDVPEDVLREYDAATESGDEDAARKIENSYSISKPGRDLKELRRKMSIVFQDPYSSLDPRMRILDIITEPMICTEYLSRESANSAVFDLLDEVGLPRDFAYRYPHELSGGQKQRVALARGIATLPEFLVLDEPTSALDVSVQAQILDLLRKIRRAHDISMLLITHNIAVVANVCDKVNVMYAGKIMESGPKNDVILKPIHPYTVALISAVPKPNVKSKRIIMRGDPPNLVTPPNGCTFHPRCPVAFDICGWTADEVAGDLEFLMQGKYYDKFGAEATLRVKDQSTIDFTNCDVNTLIEVMQQEKESLRSLRSIASVEDTDGLVEVKLKKNVPLSSYEQEDGRLVSCLLYAPGSETNMKIPRVRE